MMGERYIFFSTQYLKQNKIQQSEVLNKKRDEGFRARIRRVIVSEQFLNVLILKLH